MLEKQSLRIAELRAVIYTRVIFLVIYYVIAVTRDCTDYAEVGLKSGRKCADSLFSEELCKLVFKFKMKLQRTVKKTRAGTACTILFDRLYSGFNDVFVGRKTEIVI